ncbi:MAG: 2-oxoacid:ferredoxin oxidoreductase subunit beta [Candidatus Heimdallarchaeota archaeon]|nr:2-oxoacid:ferredoxin oxidoreductase subunit beta [Candidatus Heimdallarchaeota archaeon]MBY8993436.1 2-oxoacid:ferredoxin oxidoreductase subunit beta [Candidatus Heimdallarchaeota archaeon]
MTTSEESVRDTILEAKKHPMDYLLRWDRLPHVWCSGCGLGSMLSCLVQAIANTGLDLKKFAVVSGIGCTGRISGYLNLDVFHTTHGRAIPFAIGLKLANPELNVIVFSGDGDLFAIGGNHIIHAARRNVDITVMCSNNFNYGMTGGQLAPTTPENAWTTTSPYGNVEPSFNLSALVAAAGATYVARWTSLNARRLMSSMETAITSRGFSFIEIVNPCPTTFGRRNKFDTGLKMLNFFKQHTVIKHGIDPKDTNIVFGKDLIVGEFVVKIGQPTLDERILSIGKKAEK